MSWNWSWSTPRYPPPWCLPFCCVCRAACFHVQGPSDSSGLSERNFFFGGVVLESLLWMLNNSICAKKKEKKDINSLKLLVRMHWAGIKSELFCVNRYCVVLLQAISFPPSQPCWGRGEKQIRPCSIFICPWLYGSGSTQEMQEMQMSLFVAVFVLNQTTRRLAGAPVSFLHPLHLQPPHLLEHNLPVYLATNIFHITHAVAHCLNNHNMAASLTKELLGWVILEHFTCWSWVGLKS